MKFDSIYLLHGKGGSPNGTVRLLEDALRPFLDGAQFLRPNLPRIRNCLTLEEPIAGNHRLSDTRELHRDVRVPDDIGHVLNR